MKPTPAQIAAEIAAIEKLKPKENRWKWKLQAQIDIQVEVLKGEVDDTAEEFSDLPADVRDAAQEAWQWLQSTDRPAPSKAYEEACE